MTEHFLLFQSEEYIREQLLSKITIEWYLLHFGLINLIFFWYVYLQFIFYHGIKSFTTIWVRRKKLPWISDVGTQFSLFYVKCH